MKTIIKPLLVLFFFAVSCDSKEGYNKEEFNAKIKDEYNNYNALNKKYKPILFKEKQLTSYFSFEVDDNFLGETIACFVKIDDIVKLKNNQFVLLASGHYVNLKLHLNSDLLQEILNVRNEIRKKHDFFESDDRLYVDFFKHCEFFVVLKASSFTKQNSFYKKVEDYHIVEEEKGSYELLEYAVDLELENNGFIIKGDLLDFTEVTRVAYDLRFNPDKFDNL